jgi:hypothetical protein
MPVGPHTASANTNHPSVTQFRGYSVSGSASGMLRFRHGSVAGQILCTVEVPNGTSLPQIFPEHMITPDGVYVQIVSGTFTEGVLFNGD